MFEKHEDPKGKRLRNLGDIPWRERLGPAHHDLIDLVEAFLPGSPSPSWPVSCLARRRLRSGGRSNADSTPTRPLEWI